MSALASAVTWSVGLWRLARGRIRADWRFLVGVWLLLACSTTLLASGVVYGDAVALGSLRSAIRGAPPAEQGVLVESSLDPGHLASADPSVRNGLSAMLGTPGGTIGEEIRSGSLVPIRASGGTPSAGTPSGATPALTLLESVEDLPSHASLVAGRWPIPGRTPLEAVVSEGALAAMQLHSGDVIRLGDASTPGADAAHPVASVTIVGTYRPDADDPFWAGDPLELTGSGLINGATYAGPLVVDRADIGASGTSRLDVRWRAIPNLEALTADDIEPLRARLDALPAAIHGSFPPGGSAAISLELATRLDALATSLGVARGAVLVLILQFAVVAAYAVLLISGMLADRRRPEIGLLRSRGGSTGHVAALAFGEAVLLALPAVGVAPFAAAGLVRLLGRVGPLASTGAVADATPGTNAFIAIAITGLVAAIVLALPALASGAEVAGIRAVLGRPVARTLGQRLGIDLALLAVAAIAIWQLRAYGQPLTRDVHGALGLDPLLAAAPAFGLVAGAVIATRLVPRLGELGERVLARARGLLSPLAARQLARRPLRYTRAALLLILASALGTFGAVYATTWSTSHAAEAAYQVGSDVRVVSGPVGVAAPWTLGSTYRGIPGVTAALPIGRTTLAVGTVVRNGALLATDTATAGSIMTPLPGSGGDALRTDLAAVAAARPAADLVALPDGVRWLRVHLDAALTEVPILFDDNLTREVPPDYRGISITAVVQDGDGGLDRFAQPATAQPGLFQGKGQTIEVPVGDPADPSQAPTGPRTLLGFEISLANAFPDFNSNPIQGNLTVTGLDAAPADPSGSPGAWTPLATDPIANWTWKVTDQQDELSTISRGTIGRLPNTDLLPPGDLSLRFVASAPRDSTIPAIAGARLLGLTGSAVGDAIGATAGGVDVRLQVVSQAAEFPTLQPDDPFVIVDGATLARITYLVGGDPPPVAEWWLQTAAGASPAVAHAVAGLNLRSRSIVDRATVLAGLESDPVGLGTLGGLLLGSLAAMAFAVVGFLVGASVSTRERLTEFALLRALGLSQGQLSKWLAAEHAFLLALGVGAGTAIGLLLGWLIVPATLVSATGGPVVPTPELQIPWLLVGLVYIAGLGLLLATVVLTGRPLPGRTVATVLRAAEE